VRARAHRVVYWTGARTEDAELPVQKTVQKKDIHTEQRTLVTACASKDTARRVSIANLVVLVPNLFGFMLSPKGDTASHRTQFRCAASNAVNGVRSC
jgi:hypothetical protein